MLQTLVILALGAILGAYARFFITHFSSEISHHHGFPYGTLVVNVVGSVVVGYVLSWIGAKVLDDKWRMFMATGFCGAFTTFSAYAFESAAYLRDGKPSLFILNVVLNNVLCLAAVFAGVYLAK